MVPLSLFPKRSILKKTQIYEQKFGLSVKSTISNVKNTKDLCHCLLHLCIMEKIQQVSAFQAAMHAKCPRCREGDLFTGKAYGLKVQKMNETCAHCGLRFEREPGYFYVAMFVSYAFVVAELVTACVGLYLFTGYMEGPWPYLITAFVVALLFAPFNYRYSRVILLHWLTPGLHYQPGKKR